MAYTAENRYGLDDQSQWEAGDTHQIVARRALAAHGGVMSAQHKQELEGIAAGGAYAPSGQAAGGGGAAGGASAATNVQDQAKAASTYSANPGADPTKYATNQGTTDVVRNSYLSQATQNPTATRDDPAVRAVADANTANLERQRRQYLDDAAEKAGPYGSGAMDTERRMTAERVGQQAGAFEAQLVMRQNDIRRAEIQNALAALQASGDKDRAAMLQREMGQLDAENARLAAQTQRYGIDVGARTAGAEQAMRERLANRGYDLDASRLGFDIADREAYYNNLALQQLF